MKQPFLVLAALLIFFGCKKDSNSSAKDPTPLIKNSVWTGQFNYSGKPLQPVSIAFQEGGTATWYELTGSTTGTWTVTDGLLTVSLASGAGFTTGIAADQTFSNIQNRTVNGFSLTSAALNTLPDQSLDNTSWTGTNVAIQFKPGNKLDMQIGPTGNSKYTDLAYVKEAKTIRFNALPAYKWFAVSSNVTMMNGANQFSPDPTTYVFQLTRQ